MELSGAVWTSLQTPNDKEERTTNLQSRTQKTQTENRRSAEEAIAHKSPPPAERRVESYFGNSINSLENSTNYRLLKVQSTVLNNPSSFSSPPHRLSRPPLPNIARGIQLPTKVADSSDLWPTFCRANEISRTHVLDIKDTYTNI